MFFLYTTTLPLVRKRFYYTGRVECPSKYEYYFFFFRIRIFFFVFAILLTSRNFISNVADFIAYTTTRVMWQFTVRKICFVLSFALPLSCALFDFSPCSNAFSIYFSYTPSISISICFSPSLSVISPVPDITVQLYF